MRAAAGLLLLTLALLLTGCQLALRSQSTPLPFTTGFWFWHGSSAPTLSPAQPLDLLYAHAGTLARTHPAWRLLPGNLTHLPPARQYWLVYRFERRTPDPAAIPTLLQSFHQQTQDCLRQGHPITGLQLDIDCPTAALPQYAAFLRQLRQSLPRNHQLSITALLDWFRPATAIAQPLAEVDEFVPQFYDTEPASHIAEPLNAARWAPLFNRFGKRYRIGLSSFGRARLITKDGQPERTVFYRDVVPGDFATRPELQLETATTPAGETILTYRAANPATIENQHLNPGDGVQFILPNHAMIQTAVANARRLGGHMAGVLFFRWPSAGPNLALNPAEVLQAAGAAPPASQPLNQIEAIAAPCAAAQCTDLYWSGATTFAPQPITARIQSSLPLEYFMPAKNVPARLSTSAELRLALPPYFATSRLYLGRAVSTHPSTFTLHEER
jgi:hypothetical protein